MSKHNVDADVDADADAFAKYLQYRAYSMPMVSFRIVWSTGEDVRWGECPNTQTSGPVITYTSRIK